MIKLNKEQSRGRGDYGWLRANYSFSFSRYYNPEKMGFKNLRVINEDFIASGGGFPTHGHKNMEILTFVLKGKLGHTDSLGNVKTLTPSKIQRMYAGSGISHSEFNAADEELNLMQIWIEPDVLNLPPEYQEKDFDFSKPFNLLASPSGKDGSIKIYQKVEVFVLNLAQGEEHHLSLDGDALYIHLVSGKADAQGKKMEYGDSLEIEQELSLSIKADQKTQLLGFRFLL